MTEAMVDDELVEKVARAIAHAVSLQSDSGVYPKWSDFRDEAHAAIAIAYPAGVAAGREEAAKVCDRIADESILALDGHDARVRHEGIVAGARVAAAAIRQRGE